MGWKGGPCWFCRTDLDALMDLTDPRKKGSPELAELYRQRGDWAWEEFYRHMRADCIAAPTAIIEWRAVIREAEIDIAISEEQSRA